MKGLIWSIITRLAIACCGYINWDKNKPAGRACEDCSDYGKWKRCDNCVYALGGIRRDNWEENKMRKGFTVIEVMIVMAILVVAGAMILNVVSVVKDHRFCVAKLPGMGYDITDVGVFLKGTDYSCEDFVGSRGLRAQYELFRDGKSSGFVEHARAKKSADDAQAAANMAIGMSAVSVGVSAAGSR